MFARPLGLRTVWRAERCQNFSNAQMNHLSWFALVLGCMTGFRLIYVRFYDSWPTGARPICNRKFYSIALASLRPHDYVNVPSSYTAAQRQREPFGRPTRQASEAMPAKDPWPKAMEFGICQTGQTSPLLKKKIGEIQVFAVFFQQQT